jgi:hypothetical protein
MSGINSAILSKYGIISIILEKCGILFKKPMGFPTWYQTKLQISYQYSKVDLVADIIYSHCQLK